MKTGTITLRAKIAHQVLESSVNSIQSSLTEFKSDVLTSSDDKFINGWWLLREELDFVKQQISLAEELSGFSFADLCLSILSIEEELKLLKEVLDKSDKMERV